MISPVREMLNRDEISIQEAATFFSVALVTHLHNHNQLKVQADSALKANNRERGLLRAKLQLTVLKNRLRRSVSDHLPGSFFRL